MAKVPPANLVFLIDVSGSMDHPSKIGLLKRSLGLLLENLRDTDRISIVTYAGGEKILLNGAAGEERAAIARVISGLNPSGATNGEGGIQAAYKCAEDNFIRSGINRVILATDGDFNVGVSGVGELGRLVAEKRKTGVSISVLGFGMGNYKDSKMENISKSGNGNMYYIDSLIYNSRPIFLLHDSAFC
ncbi:MAG: VWA domain-containing protein [Deltaproteobacteria bacterium]|nr:VWA domain-containing protein [Deltaproteobacteria bacterium]